MRPVLLSAARTGNNTASLATVNVRSRLMEGAWNILRVLVEDNRLRVWLNPNFADVTGASIPPADEVKPPKQPSPLLDVNLTTVGKGRVFTAKAVGQWRLDYASVLPNRHIKTDDDETGGKTWYVNVSDPNASDAPGSGTRVAPFKSISPAAALAQPGDTVMVGAGVYRERVSPARSGTREAPITYTSAAGEQVFLKGSTNALNWTKQSDGTYEADLPPWLFGTLDGQQNSTLYNPFRKLHAVVARVPTCINVRR